ncbi:MAG: ATP-dependent RNA helicase, partial [Myxococcota bacterium]|nr:ATP-dependent RNA helicase [Myxococcota bacterium]
MSDSASAIDPAAIARLPIYAHADELLETIQQHRVVVVEGPTGSGKTTQLPRMLLHQGIGSPSLIGVTQPRRIAAVSVAWRIALEEQVTLGEEVGYAIRFDDQTSRRTQLKVMTDGILLEEARHDADFSAYGVLIVDEAHERSLNIDFTLGLLHRALEHRDDLRVIISSATMNPEVFQRYFAVRGQEAPLISIKARPHPVEMHYQPISEDRDAVSEAAAEAVVRYHHEAEEPGGAGGHVLVFMPGEGAIRATEEAIRQRHRPKDLVVLPLFGRLPREEQERVFEDFGDRRKVVIATNIAETSITIPDVRCVIDSGLAKVPRVSTWTGITTLREEGISRASAEQRAGRAGRTAPGVAVRLYTKADLDRREAFTDEEILRLDFTEVALRLINLGIRDIEHFPFPTRPPRNKVNAALDKLLAMGAIDEGRYLTDIGRRMVLFPLSPALARMVVEAADRFPDVVEDVIIACGFLSGRSPWLYPAGEEAQARDAQRRLAHPLGDVVTAVHTFRKWAKARRPVEFCERNYLDPQGMDFIGKAHEQMRDIAESNGIVVKSGGSAAALVRCVATGYPERILMAKGQTYVGPGDMKVAVHPSSVLFRGRDRFVVASEIVISRRPYAMNLSAIDANWIPELNPELARRWRLRDRSRSERKRVDPSTIPSEITIAGVTLPVAMVRGTPKLEILVEDVDKLGGVSTEGVPRAALHWKARVWTGRYRMLSGTPLGVLLRL